MSRIVTFAALAAARLALAEPEPQLTLDTINPTVVKMEYAVRGELLDRAVQLEKQLNDPEAEKLPFESIVRCNIGNPQVGARVSLARARCGRGG